MNFQIPNYDSINKAKKMNTINELNDIFTELYYKLRGKFILNDKGKKNDSYKNNNYKIMLCSIGKEENLYSKEFVKYYISLGFDKIIILDNNNLEGERFDDLLKDFISDNLVEIKDIRGLKSVQIPAFNYCYKNNMYLYDWIAFFDFDEFLFIKDNSNIKKYIFDDKFKKCQLIFFTRYFYDDNNLLHYDNRTMIERFTHSNFLPKKGKFIVRGHLKRLLIASAHIAVINNYCNSKGDQVYPNSFIALPIEKNPFAYIKHFYTKTVEEYCMKVNKGDVQFQFSKTNNKTLFKFYFK